jgi:WD repeat and SOF domain-containing protein 1
MRRLTPIRLLLSLFTFMGAAVLFIVLRRVAGGDSNWTPPNPFQDPSTLVLTKDEVARIWEWEIMSGHHPSIKPGT